MQDTILPKREEQEMGLGVFSPMLEPGVLYLYSGLSPGKPLDEHAPFDSIVFAPYDGGTWDVSYAPAWLQVWFSKTDYGFFLLKVLAAERERLLIEGNPQTGHSFWVSRYAGTFHYWPELILQAHAVEFMAETAQPLRQRPLDHAAVLTLQGELLQPLQVRGDWVQVAVLDSNYAMLGKAWIQWRVEGQMALRLVMLS
jgi:hypothetical protein